ncbi:MAG: hypothetical protein J0L55_01985 [Caulobacterales bacterium]|nr:hypothetical protein [Caulobacterales bacterium]MCA0371815.1 hypothetical protein [Pseudomonadota bacterium]
MDLQFVLVGAFVGAIVAVIAGAAFLGGRLYANAALGLWGGIVGAVISLAIGAGGLTQALVFSSIGAILATSSIKLLKRFN